MASERDVARAFLYTNPAWGEPAGEPYGVVGDLASSGDVPGVAPLMLPETIYGAAIAVALLLPDQPFWSQIMLLVVPAFFTTLVTLAAQAYTTWMIPDILDADRTCEEGDTWLRIICVGLFMVLMLNDIKEIIDVHRFLSRVPWSSEHQMLRVQKFKDAFVDESDKAFGSDYTISIKVVSGMTISERIVAYLLLLSKLSVLAVLTYYGSAYILHSRDNEALIMNSVALGFLGEIDGYFYTYCTDRTMKAYLSSMPMIGLTNHELTGLALLDEYWPAMSMFILGLATDVVCKLWC